MSAEKPTEKQILALNKLHSWNLGFHTNLVTGQRISDVTVEFCDHCKTEWPCATMKTLGVKK